MSWLRFYPDVILRKGYVNSTLYFLGEKKTIILTTKESELLNFLLEHSIEEAEERFGAEMTEKAVHSILKSGMGNIYQKKVFAEKYKPNIDFLVDQFFQPDLGIYQFAIQLSKEDIYECCSEEELFIHEGCNSCLVKPTAEMDREAYRESLLNNLEEMKPVPVNHFTLYGGNPSACWELVVSLLECIKKNFRCMTEIVFPDLEIPAYMLEELRTYNVLVKISMLAKKIADNPADAAERIKRIADYGLDVKLNVIYDAECPQDYKKVRECAGNFDIVGMDCTHLIHNAKNQLVALDTASERVEDIGMELYYMKRSCMYGKIAVTVDGNVRPCGFSSHILGNIKDGIMQVFEKDAHTKYWRHCKEEVSRCKGCENRFACIDCALIEEAIEQKPEYLAVLCNYQPEQGIWQGEKQREEEFAWEQLV